MKTAYIDCYYGVTPRKLLAAVLDSGAPEPEAQMKKLGVKFRIKKSGRTGGIPCTVLDLECRALLKPTNIGEITAFIKSSSVRQTVKNKLCKIFYSVAAAESKVHGEPVEEVHLFEVGHPAAILAATGIIAGLEELKIGIIYVSPLALGSGEVRCSHGLLSVPTPATRELTRGIPVLDTSMVGELTTPLGAAIISFLARGFGGFPEICVENIYCGAAAEDGRGPLIIYTGKLSGGLNGS
jgi:uncharacterized protein (DUF111 family)